MHRDNRACENPYFPAAPFPSRKVLLVQKKTTEKWPFALTSAISVAELLSASCSSAGKHLAAVRSRHSFAETMFHFAMPFLRLIGTKHVSSSFRDPSEHRKFCGDNHLNLAKTYYILTLIQKSSFFLSVFFSFPRKIVEKCLKFFGFHATIVV